jgi:hypothetical protein
MKARKLLAAGPLKISRFILTTALLAGAFATTDCYAKIHLKISANKSAIDAFNNWTAATSFEEIRTFRNGNASRPVVDLILELQALRAGGVDFDFELIRALTYEQAKIEVIQGRADLTAETVWDNEIAEQPTLLKSESVIRNGEFVKGIYVLPSNQHMLKITSATELRESTGAVVSSWSLDVKTLTDLQLKGLTKVATPELAFLQVQKGQADFVLTEFSGAADMGVEVAGVRLIPVPNATVAIMGSRSWIVSKSSPNADALQSALNAGLKILRDNGTIQKAFTECGFFNPAVASWKRLF